MPLHGEEEKYIKNLQKVGTKQALLLYTEKKDQNLEDLETKYDMKLYTGVIDSKTQTPLNFSKGTRFNVEKYSYPIHYGFEHFNKKDSMHYRRSGMNQVIGKLMKEKNKIYAIAAEPIINSKTPHIILGKLSLNLKIARKYGFKVIIAGMNKNPNLIRSGHQLKAIIDMLGYEDIAKNAVNTLHNYLEKVKDKV